MSARLTVPAGEIGVLRLFALDMPREQIRFLRDEPGALDDLLGVTGIDPDHVEIFAVADLEELGLPGYLREGHAIPGDQIDPDHARLAAQRGHVMVLHSRAFGGQAITLTPADTLIPLGTYSAMPADWTARPQPTPESAKPHGGAPTPRAARARARRIGGGIFAVAMVLIALLVYMVIR